MAWFKSEEERLADEQARLEAERQAQAEAQKQQEAQRRAAFEASPVGRARAAHARGDRFLRIEFPVLVLAGYESSFGSSDNIVQRAEEPHDVLGQVEDEGWRLEDVGYVFVETGSTSTARVFNTGEGRVNQGHVVGLHLFRRVEQSPPITGAPV